MDIIKIITELRREQGAISQAIAYLESLARAQGKRRGRPPAYLAQFKSARKPFSDATKKKMAIAQKKRWAAYRKQKAAE